MIKINQCGQCKHKFPRGQGFRACQAFPQGIPREIFFEGFDHHQPFLGDKGIRFEPIDATAAEIFPEPATVSV